MGSNIWDDAQIPIYYSKKNAAITTGLAGAAITNLMYGPEILGVIYLAGGGSCHSVACYLFFLLSIKKTDTLLASEKCPSWVRKCIQFKIVVPHARVLVVILLELLCTTTIKKGEIISIRSTMKGYDNNNNMFDTVTTEPFGAAILGFLDPPAAAANGDLSSLLEGGGGVPAGSARLQSTTGSGPSWSNNCLQEDDRLVAPTTLVDRAHPGGWDDILNDLENRGEFFLQQVDPTGRYGLYEQGCSVEKPRNESYKMVVVVVVVDMIR
eukprot:scaffold2858_cov109-Cylindrotheca_fusiformis.AAC.2